MKNMVFFKRRLLFRQVAFSTIIGFSILQAGCVYGPPYYGPPPHYHYYPHYHDYYFYPAARVYFHFTTGTYYYLDGTIWIKTRVLPPHIRIDARNRVKIRVDSDKPYLRFKDHMGTYKSAPNYRVDPDRNRKEREANKRWYEEYQRQTPQRKKQKSNIWP